MAECFVIQPFDNDKFDRRFTETFKPAIEAADLSPYRVDKDPAANDLVEAIKDGIERSVAVLADLTTDNPNVWYELGHAIARAKPFCLICSEERQGKYPFDIGHLKVIPYKTGSLSDFQKLEKDIIERLKAVSKQEIQIEALASSISSVPTSSGLAQYEEVALSFVLEEHLEGGISIWNLKQNMERAGFTKSATTLAVLNLIKKGLVEEEEAQNYNSYNSDPYNVLKLTTAGVAWARDNEERIVLKVPRNRKSTQEITDDDIPF